MNYLDNMVSFSTIEVYLHEPEPITTTTGWGFLEALKRGLRGAVTIFNGIVVFLIAVSPILVVIAIILVIIWLAIRSRRRRRARVIVGVRMVTESSTVSVAIPGCSMSLKSMYREPNNEGTKDSLCVI